MGDAINRVSTPYFYNILEMNNLYGFYVETRFIASHVMPIKK
jgi:hypothetical protein